MQGCGEMMIGHLTLELDLTVMTRYGREQGVERGCNSRKPERYSHHPLMGLCCRCTFNGQSLAASRQQP